MRSSHPLPGLRHKPSFFILTISAIILVSLAWSLPGCNKISTPTTTPNPSAETVLPTARAHCQTHADAADPAAGTGRNRPSARLEDRRQKPNYVLF